MRKADHHVDRVWPDLHDLHDRTIGGFQHCTRLSRLVDPRDDQSGWFLSQEQAQQLLLLQDAVACVGELDTMTAAFGCVIDAAQHVGENIVGERGDQDSDHLGALRRECASGEIRHIAEFLGGTFHPRSFCYRECFRISKEAGCRDRTYACTFGHLSKPDLPGFGWSSSHLPLLAQPFPSNKAELTALPNRG